MRTLCSLAAVLLAAGSVTGCGGEDEKPECTSEVTLHVLFDAEAGGNVSINWVEPTDDGNERANVESWTIPVDAQHFCTAPVEVGSIVLFRYEGSGELCIVIEQGAGSVDIEYTASDSQETATLVAWTTYACFPSDGEVWVTAHDPATDEE